MIQIRKWTRLHWYYIYYRFQSFNFFGHLNLHRAYSWPVLRVTSSGRVPGICGARDWTGKLAWKACALSSVLSLQAQSQSLWSPNPAPIFSPSCTEHSHFRSLEWQQASFHDRSILHSAVTRFCDMSGFHPYIHHFIGVQVPHLTWQKGLQKTAGGWLCSLWRH